MTKIDTVALQRAHKLRDTVLMLVVAAAVSPIAWLNIPNYQMDTISYIFMYIGIASAWNLVAGYMGYFNFAFYASYAIGYLSITYIAATGLSPLEALVIATLLGTLVGIPTGLLALRIKGAYYAIATLGVGVLTQLLTLYLLTQVYPTVSETGIPFNEDMTSPQFYEANLLLGVVIFMLAYHLKNSRFGLGMTSVREDEDAAQFRGLKTGNYTAALSMLMNIPMALSGAIFGWHVGIVTLDSAFNFLLLTEVMLVVLVGGQGTIAGPVIGSIILVVLNAVTNQPAIAQYLYAGVLLVVIVLNPRGMISLLDRFKGFWTGPAVQKSSDGDRGRGTHEVKAQSATGPSQQNGVSENRS